MGGQKPEALQEQTEFALEATTSLIWAVNLATGEVITLRGPVEPLFNVRDEKVSSAEAFFKNIVHPDDLPQVKSVYQSVLREEKEQFEVEYRTHPDNGNVRWIRAHAYVRLHEETRKLTGIATDITEQKQREQELERQNERLDEFARVVSHDLRNPLSVAQGRIKLAQEECDSDHLEATERAHKRMQTLINDLLTLAREGRTITDWEWIDLDSVIERSWSNVETAEATLNLQIDQTIRGDTSRVEQLFENLIRNAVEHGGGDITVTIGELDEGFYVEDNGSGISPAEREKVFESGYSTAPG